MRYLIPMLLLCALMAAACGSDSPTDPGDGGGNNTGGFEDTPAIPRPTSPGGTVSTRSEVLTIVASQPLANFAPRVIDVQISSGEIRSRPKTGCDWTVVEQVSGTRQLTSWAGATSLTGVCGSTFLIGAVERSALYPTTHPRLRAGGIWQSDISRRIRAGVAWELSATNGVGHAEMTVVPTMFPAETPHLKRERYWQLHPLEGGVGDFLLLTGPVTGEVVTSATTGSSRTETETFGRSLGASVTAGFGPVSATVEASVEESFSTSIEISEENTTSFSRSVQGEEGKTIQFMVWDLIEIYSISDANGDPYVADGWQFRDDKLQRRVALALDATTFVAR